VQELLKLWSPQQLLQENINSVAEDLSLWTYPALLHLTASSMSDTSKLKHKLKSANLGRLWNM